MSGSPFHGIFRMQGGRKDVHRLPFGKQDQSDILKSPEPQQTIGKVAVDIYEVSDSYVIIAPIAGARLAYLDIDTNGNVLTIRGKRQKPEKIKNDQYYLQECFWGPFERRITLPIEIDPHKVKATFNKDCILRITIPKVPKVSIVKVEEE